MRTTSKIVFFGGESNQVVAQDVLDHPDLRVRMFRRKEGGESRYFTPTCNGPITLRDKDAVHQDIANLKAALRGVKTEEVFMPAASPGTIAQVMQNKYYPTKKPISMPWLTQCVMNIKILIPGVIDTCSTYIEHPEVIAQRIVRFAQVVGREHVIAGTDCGFGTFLGTSVIAPSVAWDKLRSLAEGARLASKELW